MFTDNDFDRKCLITNDSLYLSILNYTLVFITTGVKRKIGNIKNIIRLKTIKMFINHSYLIQYKTDKNVKGVFGWNH